MLGLPEGGFQARFNPSFIRGDSDTPDHYFFNGSNYAHVADFWSDPQSFEGKLHFRPDSMSKPQTILLVTGVFDVRLEPVDEQSAEVVLHVITDRGLTSVRTGLVNAGEWVTLEFGATGEATAFISIGYEPRIQQPLAGRIGEWQSFSQLFVASANPRRFARPFTGAIASIAINQNH